MERAIKVLTDVKDLSELLAGAGVEDAQVRAGGDGLQLTARLLRAMPERKTLVKQGLFRRPKTPWSRCEVTLSHITSVSVKHLTDMAPDQTPLMTCEAVAGGYQFTLQAPDGLQLMLQLDQLDGSFADVGSPIESP